MNNVRSLGIGSGGAPYKGGRYVRRGDPDHDPKENKGPEYVMRSEVIRCEELADALRGAIRSLDLRAEIDAAIARLQAVAAERGGKL